MLSMLALIVPGFAAGETSGWRNGLLVEQLDWQDRSGQSVLAWDATAHVGRGRHSAWLRADGERDRDAMLQNRLEILWGYALQPRVELLAGVRHDTGALPSRTYGALGLQSPRDARLQWDITGYLGEGSPTHASVHAGLRVQGRYGWQLAPRWSVRARGEFEYWNEDHERYAEGTGSGPCELRAGLRLGYAGSDSMTWYVGGEWLYQLQDSAELTRASGGDPRYLSLVAGIRLQF
jgi:uncharacterized protein involved in copper resistance